MADDSTIIEGTVKFRDGRKWKSRWCVMRKLSPVADCVHLQLYRDSRSRCAGAGSKASLSLQQYLGCEVGFTLDKHSNTLALVCRDLLAILAFETRERLIQWQVKVNGHLGEPRQYLVLVGSRGARGSQGPRGTVPSGPARLHLRDSRCALTAGVPPRLLGVWEISHLRRYGVVEGRFCFEGGSHCGKGEGLHVLITDQAKEISHDFHLAAEGRLSPRKWPLKMKMKTDFESLTSHKTYRPETRLTELNTVDRSLPPTDLRLYEDPCVGEEVGAISPYWPSAERINFQDMGLGDTLSVNETFEDINSGPWNSIANVTIERCMSCISKLGALSRSSTVALTPGAKHFSPAWTMEAVSETTQIQESGEDNTNITPREKTKDILFNPDWPPDRPPKPNKLELKLTKKPRMPLSLQTCSCPPAVNTQIVKSAKIGPYENYDVPKLTTGSKEIENDYYDTPRRLKDYVHDDLLQIKRPVNSSSLMLKKSCGCLFTLGNKRNEPHVVESDEVYQSENCPCQKVTDWAHNWIKLSYCSGTTDSNENSSVPNENRISQNTIKNDHVAIYATIDVSQKNKKKGCLKKDSSYNLYNLESDSIKPDADERSPVNYENLNFALSLEHYENAKDLFKKATATELDVASSAHGDARAICRKCGHSQAVYERDKHINKVIDKSSIDEYLLMEPNNLETSQPEHKKLPSGYTPMSPIASFAFRPLGNAFKHPINRLLEEKSASNPTLCAPLVNHVVLNKCTANGVVGMHANVASKEKIEYRKRSSSADSSRFLDDVKEFDSSIGGSNSSIETLRNITFDEERTSTPFDSTVDNKHSDADSSETSKETNTNTLHLSKRSFSVPEKTSGNRDSSSSNDSGVSSCSLRLGLEPESRPSHRRPTPRAPRTPHTRIYLRTSPPPAPTPRRSRSTDLSSCTASEIRKIASAEAEVPLLCMKPLRGADTHSTSSGASDMSDYIETLSICSSHSSSDTPVTMRVSRQTTSTLRPRSGSEYQRVRLSAAAVHRTHQHHLYTNLQ